MRKLMLLAGAATLGLSTPLFAQGHGHGGGGGGGGGHHGAAAQHGGGHGGGNASHAGNPGHQASANASGGGRGQHARVNPPGHGQQSRVAQRQGRGQAQRRLTAQQQRAEHAIQQERRIVREARGERQRAMRQAENRRFLSERQRPLHEPRIADRRDWRDWAGRDRRRLAAGNNVFADRGRRLAIGPAGCPPGLARQNAYCTPPGQLRRAQLIGRRLPFASLGYNVPDSYRYRFADSNRYFYRYGNDGAVYRFDRGTGVVSSVIPLQSSGLYFGEPLPLGYYDVYNVPFAYRSYYPDSRDYLYRYDGNAIYRVDSDTMLVDGIVALLTGGSGGLGALGVGDPMPAGYDVYNVPFDYRDTYYDTPDAAYRYADGSIYQIDPTTQLIEAVISMLA